MEDFGTRNDHTHKKVKKVKSFQEISEEIKTNPNLKNTQPTIQPKEIDEIEY